MLSRFSISKHIDKSCSRSIHAPSPLSAGRRLSVPRRLFDPKSLLDRDAGRDASPNPLRTCGRSVWREKDSKRKKDSARRSVPSSFAPTMTHPIARLTKGEVMDWDSD